MTSQASSGYWELAKPSAYALNTLSNLVPKANKKAEGLFEVKQCSNQKTKWAGCQTLITPKGVETFKLLCQGL